MTYVFTQAERDELIVLIGNAHALFLNAPTQAGIFQAAYSRIITFTSGNGPVGQNQPGLGVDPSVWKWINGARDVNANSGCTPIL